MTVDRGVQPGVRQQAAQALDVSRRLASLERAAGSGGGGGGGGIPEAPLDGQQYGRQSGAWTVVSGGGGGGGGGSGAKFISGSVVVPANPDVDYSSAWVTFPEPFDAVPNVTLTVQSGSAVYAEAANTSTTGFTCSIRRTVAGGIKRDYSVWYQATDDSTISHFGGGEGGGGPHDHDEYALVDHDHDEFTHDHADYLPLTGGTVTGDLQVDGYLRTLGNARIDGVIHSPGTYANGGGGGANVHVTSSGYFFRTGTRGGAFAPSELARNNDVLDRAETATLPPEPETDDEGNQTNTAEVEAHDTVQLFDVVTALLLKVKEQGTEIATLTATVDALTARIETLESNE